MRNVFEWKLNDQCEAWDNARGEWRAGWIREFTHEPMAGKSMFVVAPKTGPANDLRCVEHWIREIQVPNGAIPPLANTKLPTDVMCNRALPGAHSGCDKPKGHDGLCLTAEEYTKAKAALLDLAKVGESFIKPEVDPDAGLIFLPSPDQQVALTFTCQRCLMHASKHTGTKLFCPPQPLRTGERAKRGTCKLPPAGWFCTLVDGHNGSCPTWPIEREDVSTREKILRTPIGKHRASDVGSSLGLGSSYALDERSHYDLRILGKCNKPIDDKVNYCLDYADHEGVCGQRGVVFILSEKHAAREALVEFEEACGRIKAILRKRIEEL